MFRRLLPENLLYFSELVYKKMKRVVYPKVIDVPEGSNILVLSPHPDDDVFGCGGTLYKHHLAGAKVTSVYMTDGRKGDPAFSEDAMAVERKRDAEEAAKILGIDTIFLGYKDQELKLSKATLEDIKEIIRGVDPDIVYLPFFLDNHPDHLETNVIFLEACREVKCDFGIFAYEIWTPFVPNRIVDITPVIDTKKEAMQVHKTQLRINDYAQAILGLNMYRANFSQIRGYAEAFYYSIPSMYRSLFEHVTR